MVMVIVMLLIILIVMSFGLLVYHIELMKTVKEVDRVINDDE